MITESKIRPIPKHVLSVIEKTDKSSYPDQDGNVRLYAYLTSIQSELVKITVAVRNYRKKWFCKQVAVHGVRSQKCWVNDMEYCSYLMYGYKFGWYEQGITRYRRWYERGWCYANPKYYNPSAKLINIDYISRFPDYKYSAYQLFNGKCVIEYLRLYLQYPQTEYLLKLGLQHLANSKMILKAISKDKKFCKWLITNKDTLISRHFYMDVILRAYKQNKPLIDTQRYHEAKKRLQHDADAKPIKELFKGCDLERFFDYIAKQDTDTRSYLDYLKACNYLNLDMTVDKNRFPHNFKRWHDIRIDEYHSAKALADEKERAELYKQFTEVAEKYLALQNCKKGGYAVFIAKSPAELMREGEALKHCVGRMGYDQKMVREETLIFFVRDTEKPDVPFVTVEYSLKSKKVLQCYGDGSVKPDDTVLTFVNKTWLPYANRTIRKISLAA